MPIANGVENWDDLRLVIALGRSGSYLRASEYLNIDASTIARRIRRLERAIGTKLFDRHAHGMVLTPYGRAFFEKAEHLDDVVEDINKSLSGLDTLPRGTVKIAVTEGIGYLWLTPQVAQFCADNQDIDIDLMINYPKLNLLSHEIDIAVTLDRPDDPRLVVSRAAHIKFAFFASQAYLESTRDRLSPDVLAGHHILDYQPYRDSPGLGRWFESQTRDERLRLRTNSASVYLSAARQGIGVALLPTFYRKVAADLVELGVNIDFTLEMWLVSHEETNKSRRVRLLLSYLKEQFDKDRNTWF